MLVSFFQVFLGMRSTMELSVGVLWLLTLQVVTGSSAGEQTKQNEASF